MRAQCQLADSGCIDDGFSDTMNDPNVLDLLDTKEIQTSQLFADEPYASGSMGVQSDFVTCCRTPTFESPVDQS